MKAKKVKASKAVKAQSKKTPLQQIRELKSMLEPVLLDPKHEVDYLLRMAYFGQAYMQLPLQFRHVVVNRDIARKLLESFAVLTRHKECLVCIFQSCLGIADQAVQSVILKQFLPLLGVVLEINPADIGLGVASTAFFRDLFKHYSTTLTQQQFDMIAQFQKSMTAANNSIASKLAAETLLALEEPPVQKPEFY